MDQKELKPCPFCGGQAERLTLADKANFGGDVITCPKCHCCSRVEFGEKTGLVDAWNARAALAPSDAAGAPIYQVRDSAFSWADSDPVLFYDAPESERRIVYVAPGAPAAVAQEAVASGDGSGIALPQCTNTTKVGAPVADWREDIQKVIDSLEPDDWCGDESMIDALNRALSAPQAALTDAARALVDLRHTETTRDHEIIAGIDALERALLAAHPTEQRMSAATWDVLAERRRQIEVKGFTAERDDMYDPGFLASAAAAYLLYAADALYPFSQGDGGLSAEPPINWPFDRSWWKPVSPRTAMKKGAALALAEMDRIDRDPGDESIHHHAHGGDL